MTEIGSPASTTDVTHSESAELALPAAYQRLLEQQSVQVVETSTLLKSCVTAASALARLDAHASRSEIGHDLAVAGRVLDVAGALMLDGYSVDVESMLTGEPGRQAPRVQQALAARAIAAEQVMDNGMDRALLDILASRCLGDANTVRARAIGSRERRRMAEGQRLVNDAEALEAGLDAWIGFVERGAGDVEPLLLIAASYRRWLQLRPYNKANVSLGHLLTDALVQAEGVIGEGAPPIAWRFARFDDEHGTALIADDEQSWLAWWLTSMTVAASQWQEVLFAWERELHSLQRSSMFADTGLAPVGARTLCRPGLSVADLITETGCSRVKAQRAIDAALAEGVLRECNGGRSRRYAHIQVLRILVSPSGITDS